MASAGFLLAPEVPIPAESDDDWVSRTSSWTHLTREVWDAMRDEMPAEERRLSRPAFQGLAATGNFMSFRHRDDPDLEESAKRWVTERYREWVDAGRPSPPPSNGPADYAEATGATSGIGLGALIHHREGFRALPKKKLHPGVEHGFLCNKSATDEFSLGRRTDYELNAFDEIARAYGGEHLALWTYGHAVHVCYARSASPGRRPQRFGPWSVRLTPPAGEPRSTDALDDLEHAMDGSVFAPDWKTLRAQLAADSISVAAWFAAFGLPGASELDAEDREPLWDALEQVARAHFRGEAADAGAVRRLNRVAASIDAECKLSAKPPEQPAATALQVAGAVWALDEAVGESRQQHWQLRRRAARFYWDITACAARERLTVGTDRTGIGASAALGRLLGHYPFELARDPIFLALAAHEAEAANGHAFTGSFVQLAGHVEAAGFTLSIHPADHEPRFRQRFGIGGGEESFQVDGRHAHAFLDLPDLDGPDVASLLCDWFAEERACGYVVRARPDGTFELFEFREGEPVACSLEVDRPALELAGRELAPRRVFAALGLPDLLQPGQWHEGAYAGAEREGTGDEQREFARQALCNGDVEPHHVEGVSAILDRLGRFLIYRGRKSKRRDGIVSLRVTVGTSEASYLRSLRADLEGDDLIEDYGDVWLDDGALLGYTRRLLDLGLLAEVIADAPAPVELTLDLGGEEHHRFLVG